jgi:hypothetical protein
MCYVFHSGLQIIIFEWYDCINFVYFYYIKPNIIICLFYEVVSTYTYRPMLGWLLNDELEMIWKEAVVA